MEGDSLDASLLLMPRLGFLPADDHRFGGTVAAIESQLKHGDFVYRYVERDDFGYPENAFLVCTFWYIEALALMGRTRREQARALFETILAARNRHGLLAEDLDTRTQEQWGNFPQTYCMAGIIDCAIALAEKPKAAERVPTIGKRMHDAGFALVKVVDQFVAVSDWHWLGSFRCAVALQL